MVALVAAIYVFARERLAALSSSACFCHQRRKTWMLGTSPSMTVRRGAPDEGARQLASGYSFGQIFFDITITKICF